MRPSDSAKLRTHLSELGLEPNVEFRAVRSAYRTLAMRWHPDRFEQDAEGRALAEERIRQINASFAWLDAHRALLRRSDSRPSAGKCRASGVKPPERRVGTRAAGRTRASRSRLVWRSLVAGVPLAALGALFFAQPSATSQRDAARATRAPLPRTAVARAVVPRALPEAFVRVRRLNVRAGAALDQPVVGVLEHGQRVLVTARDRGWSRVSGPTPIRSGWVKSVYLGAERPGPAVESGGPLPDLSALTEPERLRVELACLDARFLIGDAAYDRCLSGQARAVEAARVP